MKFLAAFLITLSLTFTGCATISDMEEVQKATIVMAKKINEQSQMINKQSERIHSYECLLSSLYYMSESSDCLLAGAICEERIKRAKLEQGRFTSLNFITTKDVEPLESQKKKSPTTLVDCRKVMNGCINAAYAYFMKVQHYRGCR